MFAGLRDVSDQYLHPGKLVIVAINTDDNQNAPTENKLGAFFYLK